VIDIPFWREDLAAWQTERDDAGIGVIQIRSNLEALVRVVVSFAANRAFLQDMGVCMSASKDMNALSGVKQISGQAKSITLGWDGAISTGADDGPCGKFGVLAHGQYSQLRGRCTAR